MEVEHNLIYKVKSFLENNIRSCVTFEVLLKCMLSYKTWRPQVAWRVLVVKLSNEGLNHPAHIPVMCLHFYYNNNNHQRSFKLNCGHCGGCHQDISVSSTQQITCQSISPRRISPGFSLNEGLIVTAAEAGFLFLTLLFLVSRARFR